MYCINNKSKSYLDKCFKYVSLLASFKEQRKLQAEKIIDINPLKLLAIGIGYGDEIKVLLDTYKEKYSHSKYFGNLNYIECADLHEDAGENIVPSEYDAFDIKIKIKSRYDILTLHDDEEWDCILCSFLLHDINYQEKNEVFSNIFKALKPGGKIVISEMFLDNTNKGQDVIKNMERMNEIDKLYEMFLYEIKNTAELTSDIKNDLSNHVLKTKEDAKAGKRDYFMNVEQTKNMLLAEGFMLDNGDFYTPNVVINYLGIVVASKPKGNFMKDKKIKVEI